LFATGTGGAGAFEEVSAGGTSGAPKRLAREDASEEAAGVATTGVSGFFATGGAGATDPIGETFAGVLGTAGSGGFVTEDGTTLTVTGSG
jgi:hypothetical protein